MKGFVASLFVLMAFVSPVSAQTGSSDAENSLIDAVVLIEEGRTDLASAMLDSLALVVPDNDAVHYYRGMCDLFSKDMEHAEEHLLMAVSLDSLNTKYLEALAAVYNTPSMNWKAYDVYDRLLKLSPRVYRTPYVLTLLGDGELRNYRDTMALKRYEEALSLDPSYPPAILATSDVYRYRRNYPAFFSTLEGFVSDRDIVPELKCKYLDALLKSVDAEMYRGWRPQLDTLVEMCMRTHPADSSTIQLAGAWYYGTDRKEKGEACFDRWLENCPGDLNAHQTRMQLLMMKDDWEAVIKEAQDIMAIAGNDTSYILTSLSVIGDSYHQMGKKSKAYSTYRKALELDPGYIPVLNNYAYFLSMDRRSLKKAESMSRITIEKEPDNPTYLDTYGWILFLRGRPSEAKPFFKHAIIYGGKDHKVILEHYSKVLEALGEEELAKYYKGLSEK